MEPNDDLNRLIGHYEEMLAAVRAVADRLRTRLDDLRARFPDEPGGADSAASGGGDAEESRTPRREDHGGALE